MDLIETKVESETLELSYKSNWLNWLKLVWVGRDVNFNVKVKNLNEIRISGSGEVNGQEINSSKMLININGSGNAELNTQDKLNITISGSGKIDYLGSPQVDQKISGSGEINQIN